MWIVYVAALAAVILVYVMWGRAWLKAQPWAAGFFAAVEPIERRLYQKSETLLVGRLLSVGGFLVSIYDMLAMFATGLDLTPITSRVLSGMPADMRPLVVSASFGALGLLIGWLRKRTTKPIELVAMPEADVPPAVAFAVAEADIAKEAAVEAVKAAA